jgi:hypothetical protein
MIRLIEVIEGVAMTLPALAQKILPSSKTATSTDLIRVALSKGEVC